jgi:hypothetical protein
MLRPLRPLIAIVALAGCQQPGPATDPFLYRSTIPPPGTTLSAPTVTPGPQPYYSTPPTAAAAPSAFAPDAPAAVVQPAPAPVVPVPAPVLLPQRNFPQRGGFDFPQSSNGPSPASAGAPATAVAAAGPEPAIRIVEPLAAHTAAMPADGAAKPVATNGTPTNPVSGVVLASAAAPIVAARTTAAPVAANPAAATGNIASSAPSSTAASDTSVNYPGDHPGLTYGYNPGYTALRGKLDYSVTARLWRLRYLPIDGPIDEYGGNVVIAESSQVNGFGPGDFVTVQGTLSPPTSSGASATYAISRIKRQ